MLNIYLTYLNQGGYSKKKLKHAQIRFTSKSERHKTCFFLYRTLFYIIHAPVFPFVVALFIGVHVSDSLHY